MPTPCEFEDLGEEGALNHDLEVNLCPNDRHGKNGIVFHRKGSGLIPIVDSKLEYDRPDNGFVASLFVSFASPVLKDILSPVAHLTGLSRTAVKPTLPQKADVSCTMKE